ncbi:hypothetical protein BJ138DRAFT_1153930 [Hygrophoropsis aurantiaca]|uniref:Uncharacterized protein n=1 Tax=Hygrophoropsis aurantiaca TaxID=72124 RepID=A0ACB8A9Z0_9AGAM|nr:hypothetical protein BJ138DRAFT_1153930 [Hygrophoropsis aurantiaca]
MPRKPKTIPGPSRLSKVLSELKKGPTLSLTGLRGLSLTLAARNDHFGARHFLKDELPRIRYANPNLNVEVTKLLKSRTDVWKPEMIVEFENGDKSTIDMSDKWSTTITKELMDLAGGDIWKQYKTSALSSGLPLLPGEEERLARLKVRMPQPKTTRKAEDLETIVQDMLSDPNRPKTGAAAVLP